MVLGVMTLENSEESWTLSPFSRSKLSDVCVKLTRVITIYTGSTDYFLQSNFQELHLSVIGLQITVHLLVNLHML